MDAITTTGASRVAGRRRSEGGECPRVDRTTSALGPSRQGHVHDLPRGRLHLLGFDHEKLTFPHAGRD